MGTEAKALAERIMAKVKENDWSIADFGKALGIPKGTAAHYLDGSHAVPIEWYKPIAAVLKVTMAWLLDIEEKEAPDWRQEIEKTLVAQGMAPDDRQRVLDMCDVWIKRGQGK